MNVMSLKLFFMAFLVFIATDVVWLGFIAKNLYFQHYSPWLNLVDGQLKLLWWATLMVYLLCALSVIIFIVPLANNSPFLAACYGGALGAVIYGIYNFTCLAIFRDFPVAMGFLDCLWGIVLYSWSCFLTVYLGAYLR